MSLNAIHAMSLKGLNFDHWLINFQKYYLAKSEIKWPVYQLTQTGILPLEIKAAVIFTIPAPNTIKRLRSFLGSVLHISNFIPHLAEVRHSLRSLLKITTKFISTETHTKHSNVTEDKIPQSNEHCH